MTTTDAPAATGRASFPWRFISPLLLGSTLNPINSSMIATGLVAHRAGLPQGPGAGSAGRSS